MNPLDSVYLSETRYHIVDNVFLYAMREYTLQNLYLPTSLANIHYVCFGITMKS